ncbi:hypothetical protein PBY51_009741 [Eleginops maclovinus]|uniref:Uncharacterized protein n=1 Tax=Eleginops maclovinus TaxID=56733 RepID=A0AAN8AV74_ELEMC|nr:hypothetical protein PBY51_009741 [Eleginops maclovinus]
MGHATANDLLKEIKECAGHLDLSKLISISMDGPNVDKILRALHTLLHNVPARREDYEKTTRKYQTEEPVMPYLGRDLAELIKSLMRRFVKREVLQDITTAQLTKLDIGDKNILMPVHCVDIGLGAEEALKGTPFSNSSMLRCL